ncbi:hypothetical protein, partial [Polaromonas sp. YR568]|uniref:hypothetical protein n=1 Tax=Polaromonas sp. YR568 TaxID=1855301 RepID=UPI00398BC91C
MPDIDYAGLAGRFTQNHARWGVNTTWRSALIGGDFKEAGYTEGRKAGALQIFAGSAMVLEGDLWGGEVVGDRQQKKPANANGGKLQLGGGSVEDRPWSPGTIIVSHDPKRLGDAFNAGTALGADFFVPLDPANPKSKKLSFLSDDMLNASGMGQVTFNIIGGDFELARGSNLELSPGASLFISGADASTGNIRINGMLRAAGGSIWLDSVNGRLDVGAHGGLDVSGQWINTWRDGMSSGPWAINGGAIKLNLGKIVADPQAVFDVSGGGRADVGKKGLPALRVGDAGSITLSGVTPQTGLAGLNLRAYAAGSAGSLVLETASSVQVGGAATDPSVVVLPANLYGERGFGNVTVNVRSNGRIAVPDGVTITQQAVGIDMTSFAYRDLATGERLANVAPIGVLLPQERLKRRPGGITLATSDGAIMVGVGSAIVTDTRGKLTLGAGGANGAVTVSGRLEAAAGGIELSGTSVKLNSGAQLIARGIPAIYRDKSAHLRGEVLAGGVVDIRGSDVQLAAGSLIDVSGASGEIELAEAGGSPGQLRYGKLGIAGDGGAINIKGSSQGTIRIAGDLRGKSGGAGASGGSLTIIDESGGPAGSPSAVVLPTRLYWRDPVTNAIKNAIATSVPDFDLFDQYGTVAVKLTTQMRAAITALPGVTGGGMEIVNDMNGPLFSSVLKPWEVNPAITPMMVDLLTRYFYTNAAATTRVVIPDVAAVSTSRVMANSISGGGFGSVSLQAGKGITLANGVNVNVAGSLNLSTAKLSNGGSGGSANLSASQISLNTSLPYASGAWSTPSALGGKLALSAQLIDINKNGTATGVAGTRISGFGETEFAANEIRLGGTLPDQILPTTNLQVNLDVDGRLLLKAGQIYPATAMTAVIRAGDRITVDRLSGAGAPALSAGGTLRLEAPVIEQNGVLRAPFGQIELVAGNRLTLGAGSITSVSGAGLMLPYGTLSNNEHWKDPTKAGDAANP